MPREARDAAAADDVTGCELCGDGSVGTENDPPDRYCFAGRDVARTERHRDAVAGAAEAASGSASRTSAAAIPRCFFMLSSLWLWISSGGTTPRITRNALPF